MKRFTQYKKLLGATVASLVAVSAAAVLGLSGNASALACYQYNSSGQFTTSTTPVFNNICGISGTNGTLSSTQGSYPLGDEPNFVRIRPNTSGSPLGANNPPLTDSLTSNCAAGDKFDIWTYVHNNAESQYNENSSGVPGSGSAVATGVKLTTSAPGINTVGNTFTFSSTISADNAASVSDSTTLDCNGQPVKLTLTPNYSVYYNNNLNQTTYQTLPNSVVNGTTTIGSPDMSSGIEWGCWNYRIVVVYQVEVQPVAPNVTAMCNIFNIVPGDNKTVRVSQFQYSAINASFANVVINWGDNSANDTLTDSNSVAGQTHQYSNYGTYTVSALVNFTVPGQSNVSSGGAGTPCIESVTFSPNQPPTATSGGSSSSPASSLPNTGPGSVVGIFGAATAIGAVAYRYFLGRRLSRR